MRLNAAPALLAAGLLITQGITNAADQTEAAITGRIERVENGLLPAVVVKGRTQPFRLADRMAHYRAPGLIARGSSKAELFPESANRFFVESDAASFYTLSRNARRKISELLIETGNQKSSARRSDAIPRLTELSWLLGSWKHESANSTTYETWRKLSDLTFEGESWRVSKTTRQRVFGEALLLAEMASEIFYIPKVPENPYPVAFKLTSSGPGEAVFENPKHDFPQKIRYTLNEDRTMTAIVEGTLNGQQRRLEFRYQRVEAPKQ
jgi:hypothetical protein